MLYKTILRPVLVVGIAGVLFSSCKKDDAALPQSASVSTESATASEIGKADLTTSELILGVNGHPLGDDPYIVTPADKQIKLLNAMNMGWYRVDVTSQSNGTVTVPTRLNPLLAAAAAGNVKLLPMLRPRTMSLNDSESTSYEKGKTLGANFAAKYGQYFEYYDLGNDLELPLLLKNTTGQSQDHYIRQKFNATAAYLKGMDEGIKSKDPDAKTMISAGWLHYGFLRMCEWYGVKFDVVAYHWYSDMEEKAPKSIPDITQKLSSLFPTKPIWFTEFNYRYKSSSSTNESDQLSFITKFIIKCKNNPQVKVAMIYELFDEPYKAADEATYGIIKWKTKYTAHQNKAVADYLSAN